MILTRYSTSTFLLLISMVISTSSFSQSREIDSLKQELSAGLEDTTRVKTLVVLGKRLAERQLFQEAEENMYHARELAEKCSFKLGISQAEGGLGYIYSIAGDYSKAKIHHEKSYTLAMEVGDALGAAKASANLGHLYYRQGFPKESTPHYLEAAQQFIRANVPRNAADVFNAAGLAFLDMGYYEEAYKHYNEALKLRENIGDKREMANSRHSMGICLAFQGYYTEALEHYFMALKTREEFGGKREIAESYNDIANIYVYQQDYETALKYYAISLPLFEELGISQRISLSYNNISNAYAGMGNLTEAIKNLEHSIRIKEETNDKQGLVASYNNIASIYINQGRLEESETMLQRALKYCEETNDQAGLSSTKLNSGRLLVKLGKLSEARDAFNTSLDLAKQRNERGAIPFIYRHLSYLDSLEGNFQLALQDYKMYKLYYDSLETQKSNELITSMQARFDTENKNKEILTLQREQEIRDLKLQAQEKSLLNLESERKRVMLENLYKEQQIVMLDNEKAIQQLELDKKHADYLAQKAETLVKEEQLSIIEKEKALQELALQRQKTIRNLLFIGIGLILIVGFLLYRNYVTRQKLKLQMLRNKIANDLHDDVGSTLSSISIFSEMAQNQSKEVQPLLKTIHESSRKMLEAMADIVWTINPENDQFEKIIMRMRNFAFELLGAKQIDFEFKADEDIHSLRLPMDVRKNLYLIFKEATNNMVKYSDASEAEISIKNEQNKVIMLIKDNGKGFDPSQASEGNGIKSMRKRAEEMGADFILRSLPGHGTSIELKIAV